MRSNDFMNAEDVARYLHLGKNTVYQLAKSGQLASYRVGRKLKFTLEDVESYVASTHQSSAATSPLTSAKASPAGIARDHAESDLSRAAAFGALEGDPFIIAGGDVAADLIASALNSLGMSAARLVHGSYTSLVNLYAGEANAAVVHVPFGFSRCYDDVDTFDIDLEQLFDSVLDQCAGGIFLNFERILVLCVSLFVGFFSYQGTAEYIINCGSSHFIFSPILSMRRSYR